MFKVTLRAARVNSCLTQKKAAELLEISESTLGNYEKGKTFPSNPELLTAIENLYSVKYDDIIFLPKDNGLTVTQQ